MTNKKTVFASILLIAFISITGVLYAFPFGNSENNVDRGLVSGDLDRRVATLRSTKILQFIGSGNDQVSVYETGEEDLMLIETAKIAHGSSELDTPAGTWAVLLDDTSTTLPVPMIINVSGFETQQYHFDPPVPLEAGNFIVFQQASSATDNFTSSITFYGTEPTGSGVIMR